MIQLKPNELDWDKMEGNIPIITQEATSKEVLTLAYTNREALRLTIETGWAHYFRRSHGKVLKKGITSGNVQRMVEILTDCDRDSLVFLVNQSGPACHLGERTCFHKRVSP